MPLVILLVVLVLEQVVWVLSTLVWVILPRLELQLFVGVALTNVTAGGDFMTADVVVTDGGISSARIIFFW